MDSQILSEFHKEEDSVENCLPNNRELARIQAPNGTRGENSKLPNMPAKPDDGTGRVTTVYLKGARLYLIIFGICIALFLTNLEIPIVATSLVSITDDLGGFDRATWIVSAYLLGYVGVVIIFSKLSDILGRKLMLFISVLIFVIFSAGCGAAQTLTTLIICRAFQGVGGAGCFGLAAIMTLELVPESQYAALTALISVTYSLSLIAGPIVGGAINEVTTWRWIFLLNVPAALPAIIIIVVAIPKGFPDHHTGQGVKNTHMSVRQRFSKSNLKRVDFLGVICLLIATLALVAAVEEAGLSFGWNSAFVITLLVASAILWVVFLLWERKITLSGKHQEMEPVFPWRFATSRVWIGMLVNAIFLGGPWTAIVFQLPQRFQVVNGTSAIGAGIRLLPFTASAPVGSLITAALAKKGIAPLYLVIFASALQVTGFALLGTVGSGSGREVNVAQYGYQVMAGFGSGTNISLLSLMAPFCVEERDRAVAMGSLTQFRVMGGAIGLSIVNTVMHGYLHRKLASVLSTNELGAILNSAQAVAKLSPHNQEITKSVLLQGYNIQMKVLAGLAAIQIVGSALMWQKKQITV